MTRQHGFTLVELMVTVIVAAILLAVALPSFLDTIDRTRVAGAADNLLADLRYAQAAAMKTNAPVTVTFTAGANWQYVLATTPAKVAAAADYRGTALAVDAAVAAAANQMTFMPRRNTIAPAPAESPARLVTITSARGRALGLEVTPESAMRLCTTTAVTGYPPCN